MGHYLFGFSGRINRAKAWLFVLIALVFHVIANCVFVAIIGLRTILDVVTNKLPLSALTDNNSVRTGFAVIAVLHLVLFFAWLAVLTKRLHDRDKSAWWLLVFVALPLVLSIPRQIIFLHMLVDRSFWVAMRHGGVMMMGGPGVTAMSGVATLLALWAFIDLFMFRGTEGDNRYGPDPLAGRG